MAIDLPPEGVAACVAQVGIGFCFAPVFHPSMRHTGVPRRELGIPTAMNVLGPLTNPAQPPAGLVGCADARLAPVIAEVFAGRGASVLVVRGDDGLDELTTTGTSTVWVVGGGEVRVETLDPAALGIPTATRDGPARRARARSTRPRSGPCWPGSRARSATPCCSTRRARSSPPTASGAAAAADALADAFPAAIERAAAAIDSGAARDLLDRWVKLSSSLVSRLRRGRGLSGRGGHHAGLAADNPPLGPFRGQVGRGFVATGPRRPAAGPSLPVSRDRLGELPHAPARLAGFCWSRGTPRGFGRCRRGSWGASVRTRPGWPTSVNISVAGLAGALGAGLRRGCAVRGPGADVDQPDRCRVPVLARHPRGPRPAQALALQGSADARGAAHGAHLRSARTASRAPHRTSHPAGRLDTPRRRPAGWASRGAQSGAGSARAPAGGPGASRGRWRTWRRVSALA